MTSNDPTNSSATLHVAAQVEVDFGFELSALKVDDLKKGQGATKSAYLFAKNIQNTKIDSIVSSSPYISARLAENPAQLEENKFKVEIDISRDIPVGRLNETVTVYSNRETNGKADLRIYGEIIGDIEVRPLSFNFVFSDKKTENNPKKISVINHRDDLPLEIKRVFDTQDMLVIETDVLVEGKQMEIFARPLDKFITEKGRFPGNIIIETNNPGQRSVSVNYVIIVN